MYSPVILFVYNRPAETLATLTSLESNYLSDKTDLFIFSDGPRDERSVKGVQEVRVIIHNKYNFNSITIFESESNLGLAKSIISGVSKIISIHKVVIVLEDDLVTSANFLEFMNQALTFYQGSDKIFSISGYTLQLPCLANYNKDIYLGYRASSLGWGTWADRWSMVDWDLKDYNNFKYNLYQQIRFMRGGIDMPGMLRDQVKGRIDSWAIRWCYNQFKFNQLTVFASKSKVSHIGIGKNATNTKQTRRFDNDLDSGKQHQFQFDDQKAVDKQIIREFRSKFSVWSRLKDKLLS